MNWRETGLENRPENALKKTQKVPLKNDEKRKQKKNSNKIEMKKKKNGPKKLLVLKKAPNCPLAERF